MHLVSPTRQAKPPRLDGRRVIFEIAADGAWIPCAISEAAILDVAGRKHMRPNELLGVFLRAQPRIEAIAQAKLKSRGGYVRGILKGDGPSVAVLDCQGRLRVPGALASGVVSQAPIRRRPSVRAAAMTMCPGPGCSVMRSSAARAPAHAARASSPGGLATLLFSRPP